MSVHQSVRQSIRQLGTTWLPLDGFTLNFMLDDASKIRREIKFWFKPHTRIASTLHNVCVPLL
jgi:hypothetical protein